MVAALKAGAGLEELIGLYDSPWPGQAFPYVSFDTHSVADRSHKTGDGKSHQIQLSLWDDHHDRARLYRLATAAEATLAAMPAIIENYQLIIWQLLRSVTVRDAEGPHRTIMTFQAATYTRQ